MSKRNTFDKWIGGAIKHGGLEKAAGAYMEKIKSKDIGLPEIKKLNDGAINLRMDGKYKEAIELCAEACNLATLIEPPYLDPFNTMAGIYITAGQFKEAIEYCKLANEIDPGYVYTYVNKAVALRKIGYYEDALKCCNTAIRLDETYLDAYNEKAKILTETGQFEEAIECCELAIKINPKYTSIYETKDTASKKLEQLALEKLQREMLEQEQIEQALELSKKEAEEQAAKKLADEKSQREKIVDFLSRSEDVSDDAAFPAMEMVKHWEPTLTNKPLINLLKNTFKDQVLNDFLEGLGASGDGDGDVAELAVSGDVLES